MCVSCILSGLHDYQKIITEASSIELDVLNLGYESSRGRFESSLLLSTFIEDNSSEFIKFTRKMKKQAEKKLIELKKKHECASKC